MVIKPPPHITNRVYAHAMARLLVLKSIVFILVLYHKVWPLFVTMHYIWSYRTKFVYFFWKQFSLNYKCIWHYGLKWLKLPCRMQQWPFQKFPYAKYLLPDTSWVGRECAAVMQWTGHVDLVPLRFVYCNFYNSCL